MVDACLHEVFEALDAVTCFQRPEVMESVTGVIGGIACYKASGTNVARAIKSQEAH